MTTSIQVDTALAKQQNQYQSILKLATEVLAHMKIWSQKSILRKKLLKLLKKACGRCFFRSRWQMQTYVLQTALLKDLPRVFSWEIYIFFWLLFSRTLLGNYLCILPYCQTHAQRWHKNNPKHCSTVLRYSFIYYPETSLCHLWTDIFNRVLEWNNFSSETLHRILLVKKPAAAPAHICTNGLSLSTPAWVIPFVAFA